MLNNKKRKWLRLAAVVVVLALVVGVVSVGSAIGRAGVQTLMKAATYNDFSTFLLSDADAADPAGFSSLDPIGAPYVKAAENESLILYYYTATYDDPRLQGGEAENDIFAEYASGVTNSTDSANGTTDGSAGVDDGLSNLLGEEIDNDITYEAEDPSVGTIGYIENVIVYDKRSGEQFSAIQTDRSLLDSGLTDSYYYTMQSLVTFRYIDLVRATTKKDQKNIYSYVAPHEMTVAGIQSGVRFSYNFPALNIRFALDFTIDGSDFTVKMPNELIYEEEEASTGYNQNREVVNSNCNEIAQICTAFEESMEDAAMRTAVGNLNDDIDRAILNIRDKLGTDSSSPAFVQTIISKIDMLAVFVDDTEQIARLRALANEILVKMNEILNYRSTGMTEVELMPYFGSQRSSSKGYAFYPDNGGAISYFGVNHPTMSGEYAQVVYDEHSPEQRIYDEMVDVVTDSTYINPAQMPVFGISDDLGAFLAIVTDGEYDCSITYAPLRSDLDIASLYTTFYLRKGTKRLTDGGGQVFLYDTLRTKQDWGLRYRMLSGDDAGYSGMAVSYREYLLQTGRLSASPLMEKETAPLGLEFFMGANSSRQSLFSEYVTMTRFSDVLETLQRLEEKKVSNVMISISDWQQDSSRLHPADPVPASQIGGEEGLQELAEYVRAHGGLLSLADEHVWIRQADVSSSLINVASVQMKSLISFESYGWYMLNPTYIFNQLLDEEEGQIARYYSDYGVNALTLYNINNSLYFDYNPAAPAERRDTALQFAALARQVGDRLGYTVSSNANAYLWSGLDWNMSLPVEGSGYSFTDETVPFTQIVLHGFIAYTGDGYNYLYDKTAQTLKEIEYGYLPFYYLTEEEPFEIRNIGWTGFYSTVIDSWFDRMVDVATRYQADFSDVWNAPIVAHASLSDTLAKTVYETRDGERITVYVNYAETAAEAEGHTIEAENYLVVRS